MKLKNGDGMKIINFLMIVLLNGFFLIQCRENFPAYQQKQPIYVYTKHNQHIQDLLKVFNKFSVQFELVDSIINDDQKLYVICDVFTVDQNSLPKYYIAYQPFDLQINQLSNEYINKLAGGVAVWDCDQQNINKYRDRIYNYYYLPKNYEYADPVILPVILPVDKLGEYKKFLIYSNQLNTDISSHIPTLFVHCLLKEPKIIVEAGVRGGQSTKPLSRVASLCNSKLIGLDIIDCSAAYSSTTNACFLRMNDLDFPNYYRSCDEYKAVPIDIIFIDTSHTYDQTIKEITVFVPLLSDTGCLMFHDANVAPLDNNTAFVTLTGVKFYAPGNEPGGVARAINDYFGIHFDPTLYSNFFFEKEKQLWHFTHYPFCNGLTIIEKVKNF